MKNARYPQIILEAQVIKKLQKAGRYNQQKGPNKMYYRGYSVGFPLWDRGRSELYDYRHIGTIIRRSF